MNTSLCRSCGCPVTWAKSANTGRWMILQAAPRDSELHGNVVIVDGQAYVYRDTDAADEAHPDRLLYIDHHATCPQAKDWRKK